MTDKNPQKTMSDKHNRFHAEKRRARRDAYVAKTQRKRPATKRENTEDLLFYGLHTVGHALANPKREKLTLYATKNALSRLETSLSSAPELKVIDKSPRELDRMVGSDAVHQGAVLHVTPLETGKALEAISADLVLVLDQVTDPHNVGAIMRSAVALNAGGLITTSRYSPNETGVLAKSASGALELLNHIEVRNLGDCLETLKAQGYSVIGLDSEGTNTVEELSKQEKIALVLGAEGKGLRQRTRSICDHLVRLDMPGQIKSLNVSNAAALALYITRTKLSGLEV